MINDKAAHVALWGPQYANSNPTCEFNRDNAVGITDLLILAGDWSK